jgi:hypothetical protein
LISQKPFEYVVQEAQDWGYSGNPQQNIIVHKLLKGATFFNGIKLIVSTGKRKTSLSCSDRVRKDPGQPQPIHPGF